MTVRAAGRVLVAGILLLVILPDSAWAWTPGTHIYLGESILTNLRLLPAATAELLHAFPYDFLYGTIAPDTSIAKHYVPPGRHSHFWQVGHEVHTRAEQDALRAFGLGYLTHLAADTVAHNYFVPRQLLLTSSTRSMGHSYWESRAETHLTDRYARRAREIIQLDHEPADRHLEQIISPTLFSVPTNRRIFRGMVHLTHTRSWQRAMQVARERSRWLLTDADVERHLGLAYDFSMETLAGDTARVHQFDPVGHDPLQRAKRIRRTALLSGGWYEPERLLEVAEGHFGLPTEARTYWRDAILDRPWVQAAAAAAAATAVATVPRNGSPAAPDLTPDSGTPPPR